MHKGRRDPSPRVVQEMFAGAHHFQVNDSTFYTEIRHGEYQDAVSTVLTQHIAPGATFDSAERYPPGKCHPGTRDTVVKTVIDWINDPTPAHSVLWLYGPAGSGKSALAQSIAALLYQLHRQRYGASFFFARDSPDRGHGNKLFPTIVYQLAVQFPLIRNHINAALSNDPTLPTKSIDIQIRNLLVEPLLNCTELGPLSHTPTIIIDGLDECAGSETQREVLSLISQALNVHRIPIRFFISSRPEYCIRETFDGLPLASLTKTVLLSDDEDADNDIRKYLREGFDQIFQRKLRIMSRTAKPWPPEDDVDRLVRNSSGQFLHASTVLKFVSGSSDFCDPREQLRIIMTPGTQRSRAFSDLDKLYTTILSSYPRREPLKAVLGGLLAGVSPMGIHIVLKVDAAEVVFILDALSSLITVTAAPISDEERLLEPIFGSPLEEDRIHFCHLSFREFLEDPSRSGPFRIDNSDLTESLLRGFIRIIGRNVNAGYGTEPHILHNLGLSVFNTIMETLSFSVGSCDINTLGDEIFSGIIIKMRKLLSVSDIRYPACLMRDMTWLGKVSDSLLSQDLSAQSTSIASELKTIVNLAWNFGLKHLLASPELAITPTLAHIFYHRDYTLPVHNIFTKSGHKVTEILSCLQKYRHIIYLQFYSIEEAQHHQLLDPADVDRWHNCGRTFMSIRLGFSATDNFEWFTHSTTESHDPQISLVYQIFDSLIHNPSNSAFDLDVDSLIEILERSIDRHFFQIHGDAGAFRRSFKIPLLKSLTDTPKWLNLHRLPDDDDFECIIDRCLSWFNFELKNPPSLQLIMDYDDTLPGRMLVTMRRMLMECFDPSKIYYNDRGKGLIRRAHNLYHHLFGGLSERPTIEEAAICIYPAWLIFPPLASFVLSAIVHYHRSIIQQRPHRTHNYMIERDIETSYVFRCLPHARPTAENLAELRVLRFMYTHPHLCSGSQIPVAWHPPAGFCESISYILAKYNETALPQQELNSFKEWLSQIKSCQLPHSRYMDQFGRKRRQVVDDLSPNFGLNAASAKMAVSDDASKHFQKRKRKRNEMEAKNKCLVCGGTVDEASSQASSPGCETRPFHHTCIGEIRRGTGHKCRACNDGKKSSKRTKNG